MRLPNIATLDACMNHFTRLIDLTSADEAYVSALAVTLAPCILRPKTETSLTMEEKHAWRLIRDLFAHKDAIFSELKRMSSLSHSGPTPSTSGPRLRAISTDESNRKAHMEERNRLLLNKASRSRAASPAPSPRGAGIGGHRRDRSNGGPETRFPIASPIMADRHRSSMGALPGGMKRQSLEVPGSETASPDLNDAEFTKVETMEPPIEKRNSLGRSSARFSTARRLPITMESPRGRPGVTLEDRPMDDSMGA